MHPSVTPTQCSLPASPPLRAQPAVPLALSRTSLAAWLRLLPALLLPMPTSLPPPLLPPPASPPLLLPPLTAMPLLLPTTALAAGSLPWPWSVLALLLPSPQPLVPSPQPLAPSPQPLAPSP